MLEQLRGRNLAHVGCTLGLVLGLLAGLAAGLVIIQILRSDSSVNIATFVWIGVTVALGALGYYLGTVATRRLWGTPRDE